MSDRVLLLAIVLTCTVAACGGDVRPAQSKPDIVRDSAGIAIVENRAPAWSETEAWRVADTATLQMGVAEGDPDHEFYQIAGVARLSDGTIVVANAGTQQLRYFAPDGSLRATAGRKGGGPGEFEMLTTLIGIPGDSVLTFDASHRRFSVFDASGRHVRDFGTSAGGGSAVSLLPLGRLDDGTYIAQQPNVRIGP
jgi:hypothetical protein